MKVRLTALKDFETMDMWQNPIFIDKDTVYIGDVTYTDKGLELITLRFNNVSTVFDIRVIKKFFEVEYLRD